VSRDLLARISGLDVARFGDDNSALVRRTGNKAKVEWVVYGNNTMELGGRAAIYLRANKATKLFVDITGGLGAVVFDRLKEQPDIAGRVYGVSVAGKPRDEATYINIRVESWCNVRDWLKDAVLEKHEGFYQLAQPKYKLTSAGKLQLEGKEDMKKRGVASPDVGDALALTLSRPTEGDNLGLVWLRAVGTDVWEYFLTGSRF